MLGVGQGTVQPWISEARRGSAPDAASLYLIASRFKVSGHWLLMGQLPQEAPGEPPNLRQTYISGWYSAGRAYRQAFEAVQGPEATESDADERAARRAKLSRETGGEGQQPPEDPPAEDTA